MNNNIIILIILSLLQFLVDICSNPCHTIIGYPILFLHHILGVYIYIGGFLFNAYYHMIFLVLIIIHWQTNKNKCKITELTNSICYPEYTGYKLFNDIVNMLNLHKINYNISYVILYILIVCDIFIYYNKLH